MIRSFGESIYSREIDVDEANRKQANLIKIFQNSKISPDQNQKKMKKKNNTFDSIKNLYQSQE